MCKEKVGKELSFEKELQNLINKHSVENESNTPDFILAKYIDGCLKTFSTTVKERDQWYGFKPFHSGEPTSEKLSKDLDR